MAQADPPPSGDPHASWKTVLETPPAYAARRPGAVVIDTRAAQARAALRGHLNTVRALEQVTRAAPPAPSEAGFLDVVAAVFGPEDVAVAWRRWRGDARPGGALDRLEKAVEDAQRQVSQVARWMEQLDGEERSARAQVLALRAEIASLEADAELAEARAAELERAALAVEIERARLGNAATEADALAIEAERAAAASDARAFRAGARQLVAVAEVGAEVLSWCGRLGDGLEAVHADGAAALSALDLRLGQLAAEARASDLGATIATNLDGLRAEIGRVHVRAREGADDIVRHLDRLAEAPDLLAPVEAEGVAAEVELADLDRRVRR